MQQAHEQKGEQVSPRQSGVEVTKFLTIEFWDENSDASAHDTPVSISTCTNNIIEIIFIAANIQQIFTFI